MALIKEFFELTKKYEDEYGTNTVFLIQVGSFYECYGLKDTRDNIYGSNILEFSRICDLNIVDKRVCVGAESVVMGGFKESEITGITIGINAEDGKIVKDNHNSTISYKNVWGGNKDVTESKVNAYYDKFKDLGVEIIEPAIGKVKDPHGNLPIYAKIGAEIDKQLK